MKRKDEAYKNYTKNMQTSLLNSLSLKKKKLINLGDQLKMSLHGILHSLKCFAKTISVGKYCCLLQKN